jgi:peptide/nickel transport system permease protein
VTWVPRAVRRRLVRRTALGVADAAARLLAVLFLGFLLFHALPGDPVAALSRGRPVTGEQVAQMRREMGLDRPLFEQFRSYLAGVVQGDLGTSFEYHRPVLHLIGERLGPTLLLAGAATALSVLVGLVTGARAGWRQGSRADRASTGVALVLWSAPTFWLGMVLLVVLGVGPGPLPGLFPTGGMRSPAGPDAGLGAALDVARHLVLPCVTLSAVQYAQYHLIIRSSVAAQRGSEYATLARAKGLRDAGVRWRHAVPNALPPTLMLVFTNLGFLVSGAITVEAVFSWPGLGYLTYEAMRLPDLPLLHGTFLVLSAGVVAASIVAEAVLRRFDRRVGTG